LILLTQRSLGLPSGLFLSAFCTKLLYTLLISPHRATYPAPVADFKYVDTLVPAKRRRKHTNMYGSDLKSAK